MRSRGPISADERHSYDEEEISSRPAPPSNERIRGGNRGRATGREIAEDKDARHEVLVVRRPARNWGRFTSREGSTGSSRLACPALT